MLSFEKQPSEQYPISLTFGSSSKPAGTVISSATVKAEDMANNNLVSGAILVSTTGTINSDGNKVTVTVKGGVKNKKYKITFVVTLNTGDILEEELIMLVRER